LATSVVTPLDSAKAGYKGLSWTEKGDGLAVLRGVEDKAYENKLYAVVGFTDFGAKSPRKAVYDPKADKSFPAGMTACPDRNPSWTEDLGGILFGIHDLKKKEDKSESKDEKAEPKKDGPPDASKAPRPPSDEPDKPDLVVWHWQDDRLQSQQQVQ